MWDFARLELGYVFFRSICTRIIFKALLDASGGGRPPVYGPENKKQTDCEPCIYRQYVVLYTGCFYSASVCTDIKGNSFSVKQINQNEFEMFSDRWSGNKGEQSVNQKLM